MRKKMEIYIKTAENYQENEMKIHSLKKKSKKSVKKIYEKKQAIHKKKCKFHRKLVANEWEKNM